MNQRSLFFILNLTVTGVALSLGLICYPFEKRLSMGLLLLSAAFLLVALFGRKRINAVLFVMFVGFFGFLEYRYYSNAKARRFDQDFFRYPRPYTMFGGRPNVSFVHIDGSDPLWKESHIKFNHLGFRFQKPISRQKEPGEYRVFVIGGSTLVLGTTEEKTIPGYLQTLAHKSGKKNWNVYNFGIVSAVTGQQLSLVLHELVAFQPDLIISYDGANDILSPYYADPRPNYPFNFFVIENKLLKFQRGWPVTDILRILFSRSYAVKRFFGGGLQLGLLTMGERRQDVGYQTDAWEQAIVHQYIENLKKMCAIAKTFGFSYAAYLQPLIQFKNSLTEHEAAFVGDKEFNAFVNKQYGRIRTQINQTESISRNFCVTSDLSKIFQDTKEEIYWDNIHIRNEGNHMVADAIYHYLLQAYKTKWGTKRLG